jgi:hypothetical protein
MSSIGQAVQAQIINIQKKTGKSFEELATLVLGSGLDKHAAIREMLMREFSLGYGDANALVHAVRESDGARAAQASGLVGDGVLDQIYAGPKAALRPIHDALMSYIQAMGEFETLPKKGYVSLRRKKQFAMIGPTTNTRVEVGLNAKSLDPDARLLEQPKGSMCNYVVRLTSVEDVDQVLVGWILNAYEGAG